MKYYSNYTIEYVQDICDALTEANVFFDKKEQKRFSPENFDTLTNFLQKYVVMPLDLFTFLDNKGLVNRWRCPYTGKHIDLSSPKWTYMNSRSIYVSKEGFQIMQREDDEDFEKILGVPPPKRKEKGCYIATVCYGNEFATEVLILKRYRDEILSKSFWGRLFIKIYYSVSPAIARQLENKKAINEFIKIKILNKIVRKINKTAS